MLILFYAHSIYIYIYTWINIYRYYLPCHVLEYFPIRGHYIHHCIWAYCIHMYMYTVYIYIYMYMYVNIYYIYVYNMHNYVPTDCIYVVNRVPPNLAVDHHFWCRGHTFAWLRRWNGPRASWRCCRFQNAQVGDGGSRAVWKPLLHRNQSQLDVHQGLLIMMYRDPKQMLVKK